RYVITLKGLARFRLGAEQAMVKGYRVAMIDTAPYRADYEEEARASGLGDDAAAQSDARSDSGDSGPADVAISSDIAPPPAQVDRERLFAALEVFTTRRQIKVDWESLRKAGNEALVTTLAMVCPFAPEEKQALLEAADLTERARALIAMIEMAVLEAASDTAPLRH
ncbi:MAG: LON peptidase substrate-binding domain-containing protein, partial [Alphaproteobacteria bacterium]